MVQKRNISPLITPLEIKEEKNQSAIPNAKSAKRSISPQTLPLDIKGETNYVTQPTSGRTGNPILDLSCQLFNQPGIVKKTQIFKQPDVMKKTQTFVRNNSDKILPKKRQF